MRRFLLTALLCLPVCLCGGQDNIPLPDDPAFPLPLPAETEAPVPLPGVPPSAPTGPVLPRVQPPRPPAFPQKSTVAPRVKMVPGREIGESSIQGGQFHVHGKIKEHRDVLLQEAEATRRMVLGALRLPETFTFPIVVQIRDAAALRPGQPAVWTAISQTPGGFRIELNLVPLRNTVDGPLLRQELVRCILAEIILRPHANTDLDGRDTPPPDWLLHGLLELLEYQARGRPSETFAAVFRLGHVLSIEDIFEVDPRFMDSVSLSVYRSSCCGLLLLLLEHSGTSGQFSELCKLLALMSGDDASAIARAYPSLSTSGNSLGKWWSLQLATMAQPGLDELLSPQETEQELAKALIIPLVPETAAPAAEKKPSGLSKIFGKKKKAEAAGKTPGPPPVAEDCPLDQYARILLRKDRAAVLSRYDLALGQVALRAHPLYRPVIAQYLSLTKALAAGKREKEAAATLASLVKLRGNLMRDLDTVENYLNWFEATQMPGISDTFRTYLKAAEEIARPPVPRRDPLSRYLNLIEQEFQPED